MKKKIWIPIIVLLLLAGTYFVHGYLKGEVQEVEQVLTRTVRVRTGDMKEIFFSDGSVQSTNRLEVRTKVVGEVEEVFFVEGDRVEEGDVLLTLRQEDYLNKIIKAQGELEKARTALAKAELESLLKEMESPGQIQIAKENLQGSISVVEDLEREGAPKEQLLEAKGSLQMYQTIYHMATGLDKVLEEEARVQEAMENLIKAQGDLLQTIIRAPMTGIISGSGVLKDDLLGANNRIASITSYEQVKVVTNIDEFDIRFIQLGQESRIIPDAFPDITFKGTIVHIAHEAKRDGGLVVFETVIQVDNPKEILRPGMTVEAEIIIQQKEGILLVPTQAIEYREGDYYVVKREGEEEILQWVRIGLNDGINTEIISGLELGDNVVVYMRVTPAAAVPSPTPSLIPGLQGSSRMGR